MDSEVSDVPLELATIDQITFELMRRDRLYVLCLRDGSGFETYYPEHGLDEAVDLMGDCLIAICQANGMDLLVTDGRLAVAGRSSWREAVAWSALAFVTGIAIVESWMLGLWK